MTRSIIPQI